MPCAGLARPLRADLWRALATVADLSIRRCGDLRNQGRIFTYAYCRFEPRHLRHAGVSPSPPSLPRLTPNVRLTVALRLGLDERYLIAWRQLDRPDYQGPRAARARIHERAQVELHEQARMGEGSSVSPLHSLSDVCACGESIIATFVVALCRPFIRVPRSPLPSGTGRIES